MLFAAIDIGSNAARLLFANAYNRNGAAHIDKASLIRIPTRLGVDVYHNNKISKDKAHDFIKTMKAFKLLIDVYRPETYLACATAAMREAENSEEILKKIKKETGLKIKIIDGKKEAEIIRSNSRILFPSPKPISLYIDVGGGSTELSIEKDGELYKQKSFKLGTLRLIHHKVKVKVWEDIKEWLLDCRGGFTDMQVIGTGGNINKLCKTYGDNEKQVLNIGNLQFAYNHLRMLSVDERIRKYGFRPDRADVIVPAASIYIFVMEIIQASSIFVPRIGLVDGLILKQYKDYQLKKRNY